MGPFKSSVFVRGCVCVFSTFVLLDSILPKLYGLYFFNSRYRKARSIARVVKMVIILRERDGIRANPKFLARLNLTNERRGVAARHPLMLVTFICFMASLKSTSSNVRSVLAVGI